MNVTVFIKWFCLKIQGNPQNLMVDPHFPDYEKLPFGELIPRFQTPSCWLYHIRYMSLYPP